MRLTKLQREALAEMIGAINDAPKGSEFIMGRGFYILSGPLKDVVMALAGDDREELELAIDDLARVRPDLRSLGGS